MTIKYIFLNAPILMRLISKSLMNQLSPKLVGDWSVNNGHHFFSPDKAFKRYILKSIITTMVCM